MKGPLGYGRYDDDPEHVGCPRAHSDMTPCAARDGGLATVDFGACIGCGADVGDLLRDLVREVTKPPDETARTAAIKRSVSAAFGLDDEEATE